jgi:hypothetical protein
MQASDIDSMSDEEAIAAAALLGATFTHVEHEPRWRSQFKDWTCWDDAEGERSWTETHADTQGEAARFFLRRHLLPKVTP